jgi:pimeloyl-ACP methyl ester carboxylesterase
MKLLIRRNIGMTVVFIIVGVLVGVNLIGFAVNKIFFANELKNISPYGKMVDVNGRKMHLYSMGDGEKTVVLLPGFGVALPCADFGPLMRELSKEYTVVCIEYFGVGFSEQTDTPRTNENYTKEIRAALSLAGFKAPYILMPHSASGVYCEYYAANYPDEVSAILMLDTTSTAKVKAKNPPRFVFGIGKLQQACGLTRLTYALVPSLQKAENGYTEKEIRDYKLFACHVLNDTMIDQSLHLLDNINELDKIPFPQNIPVMKLISAQSKKKVGEEYQTKHLNRLGEKVESIVIDSTHFIYQTKVSDICDATRALIAKIN